MLEEDGLGRKQCKGQRRLPELGHAQCKGQRRLPEPGRAQCKGQRRLPEPGRAQCKGPAEGKANRRSDSWRRWGCSRQLPMQRGPAANDRPDASEVYSPPRVTATADESAGWALDFRTVDKEGLRWDLSIPERRQEALRLLRSSRSRPRILVRRESYVHRVQSIASLQSAEDGGDSVG